MAIFKDIKEIETLKEAGRRLAFVLDEIIGMAKPGATSKELDERAEFLIKEKGDIPAFLGYTPRGAKRAYPATLCVSINNEVVHGIPNEQEKVLRKGDIVGLDIGLSHKGVFVDMAKTVAVGGIDDSAKKLLSATENALMRGIAQAVPGNQVGDISHAIESAVAESGFQIVRVLGGHGVGKKVHEEPYVPNFGEPHMGAKLTEGMVLAIEPIVNEKKPDVKLGPDGYTYFTKDGGRSAHFEHTILITKNGPEIVTKQ